MAQDEHETYRLVSDYGFGDKTWVKRGLTAEEAVRSLNRALNGTVVETVEAALDYEHPIYSIEVDHEDDEEDWDWVDS